MTRRWRGSTLAGLAILLVLLALYFLAARVVVTPADLRAPADWTADVALVLNGDPGGRTYHAVRCLRAGRVPRLMFTGGGGGGDSAVVLAKIAEAKGVPHDQIVLEEHATSTLENFVFSRPILERLGARRVLVVTSRTHGRRAGAIGRRVLTGREVRVEPVDTGGDPYLAGLYELAKLTRTAAQGHIPWGAILRR